MDQAQDLASTTSADRRTVLPFFLIYVVIGTAFVIGLKGGWFTLVTPLVVVFVAVPIADALIGLDRRDPPEKLPGGVQLAILKLATWAVVPARLGVVLWGVSMTANPSVSLVELVGAVVFTGVMGGSMGITVAHELVHRRSLADRALGWALLATVGYMHWAIEHVAGHHRWVATPRDPATARLGESLPAFLVRSIVGSWRSAFALEAAHGRTLFRNRVVLSTAFSVAVAASLGFSFGAQCAVFFIAQAAVAIVLLETVNYVEHYGLERRLLRPGVYERVTPLHSWNASHRLTNFLLFNLQRHSDHHAWPQRPYYQLRHHDHSPQLPLGYAGMALLAMVPPLFHRVMDPRVAAHRESLSSPIQRES